MSGHLFVFKTTWRVPRNLQTVWDSIGMVAHYPAWWPGMQQVEIVHGHEMPIAVGNAFRFLVASPLYRLSYTTTVTSYELGKYIIAKAEGDLEGTGTWTFEERLTETVATFVWEVALTPRLLGIASSFPPVRPVMRFFHNRLMNAGERGLNELLNSSRGSFLMKA